MMPAGRAGDPGNHTLIDLCGVYKSYRTGAGEVPVLKDVNLQVGEGEFVGIVGPSGSGKSTLINMFTGIDRPTRGDVWVAGQRLNDMSEDDLARFRRKHVGVIFQFFQLLPTLTVIENVMLPMALGGVGKRQERYQRAMELLKLVEVPETAHKFPSQTSGGQQQRAAIARALANDPLLVVGDEPTGNLDTVSAGLVFALFEDLVARGKTLIMVTHDRELARLLPRIEEVRDGRLVQARSRKRRPAAAEGGKSKKTKKGKKRGRKKGKRKSSAQSQEGR
jgi:putative ABC transport system ATP-binding protein